MAYFAVMLIVIATISSSFARPLAKLEYRDDIAVDVETAYPSPLATIILGTSSVLGLLFLLSLCACGEKTKKVEVLPSVQPSEKTNGGNVVVSQIDTNVSFNPPNGNPSNANSQLANPIHMPPSPDGAASPAESSSPTNMKRTSTVDRRLPELPPIPSKVPDIAENPENDYNGTYDTIKDDKKKDASAGKLVTPCDDDPAYNSVEETMGGAMSPRTGGAIGGGRACPDDVGDDNYASVKEANRQSRDAAGAPGGAEGSLDESDYDGSYAAVRDIQTSNQSSNHPYAVVKDKKEREHGYARVKDVHVNPTPDPPPEGAVGGMDGHDEAAPPVPQKPMDLDLPDNPSSPSSQRAGSVSPPASPDPARDGPSPAPGGLGGPGGDGPGWLPGPGPGPVPDSAPSGGSGTGRREPPYTQVSARESLESIRARQQQQHTQLTEDALAGVATGTAMGAGEDFDGIYEQVDDNSVRGQNSTSPPPLPRGRQTVHVMGRGRVYEEITEDNRPRPPAGAGDYDEDPEPYAVVDKTHTEQNQRDASSNSNGNHQENRSDQKDFDQLYAKVDKSGNKPQPSQPQHQLNNNNHNRLSGEAGSVATGVDEQDFGALYAKVDKKRKTIAIVDTRSSRPSTSASNANGNAAVHGVNGLGQVSAMNSLSDIYADVDDRPFDIPGMTRNLAFDSVIIENNYQSIDEDQEHSSPIDERMVHISEHKPNPTLWLRREHTYQAVGDNTSKKKSKQRRNKDNERKEEKQHSYENVKPTGTSGGSSGISNMSSPSLPERWPSKGELELPDHQLVKAKNTNNNHMIETLPVKETRI